MTCKRKFTTIAFALALPLFSVSASEPDVQQALASLLNYQVNTASMVSSGQPDKIQFEALAASGVSAVIDLVPGDRTQEQQWMQELGLDYRNIQVDWDNPTLADFATYVAYLNQFENQPGGTLTHCRKNWRGAVFTYLYRVTQLNHEESVAYQDMVAIWQPNETWLKFIEQVKAAY
ncbi:hypothetical protein DXV75_15515 [Alteromonas aestuariivivens]|uniref:Phosphatase n=1 Tax=Alteromonas aestuariivivens TaxID=1938339 RepID=A0A3D8M3G0_9ALTE|nr:protein tyrosine phosphatase family protein [Alteromonas aestuariivivens]RDV24095.1 hypothetical protein DXV75_15515 [Alteromonas aestuariivivens]